MKRSTPKDDEDQARTAPQGEKAFGSRPFAALAPLASQLPTPVTPSKPQAAAGDSGVSTPMRRALAGRIVINRESKGRGGRIVTFARGIVASATLLETLAKELRHELGAGVRVEDGALMVQGAQSERLAASLARRGAGRIVIGN